MEYRLHLLTRWITLFTTMTAPALAHANQVNGRLETDAVVGPVEYLNIGMSLMLIIAAVFAVGWLYRRTNGMRGRGGEVIRVLATQPLGTRERVLLVEIAGTQLVLGMTASQIQTLHVLEQPIVDDRKASLPAGFVERLRAAINGAGK